MYCCVWFGCIFFFLKNLYNSMTGCLTSHCIRKNMDCGWLRHASWNKNGVFLVNIVCEHILNSWGHASVPLVIAGTRMCKLVTHSLVVDGHRVEASPNSRVQRSIVSEEAHPRRSSVWSKSYENVHCSLLPRQTQSFLCGKFSTPQLDVLTVF